MVNKVKNHEKLKKKTGRPSKLSLEEQVLMTLEYLREYRTYFHIGQSWGLNESNVYRTVTKIEKILIKAEKFRLPGKKELLKSNKNLKTIVIDVTETPIERPKKNKSITERGKKKRHTLKSQIVINQETRQILCTASSKGREHDFSLFKKSNTYIAENTICLGDQGYQGIQKIHKSSCIPYKKPQKQQLSPEQKKYNRNLASVRIVIEHVYRCLKIFRILSERYRNRRKRFSLRFNLIAGIYNYELLKSRN